MMTSLLSLPKKLWLSPFVRQLAIVIGFFEVYQVLRSLIVHPNDWDAAMNHAAWVMHVERIFHLSWETRVQGLFLHLPRLVEAMNIYYFICQFAVTGAFLLWLFFRHRDGFYLIRNAIIFASLIGLIIYWRFPTAPPRLAEVGIADTLRDLSGIDLGHSPTSAGFANPLAAVPSLHAAWAIGVGYGAWRYGKRWWAKLAAVVYPLTVFTTIVATGNHFVFDAIAGAAVMVAGFGLVNLASRRPRPEPAFAGDSCRNGNERLFL
jgi:hypothetical protein